MIKRVLSAVGLALALALLIVLGRGLAHRRSAEITRARATGPLGELVLIDQEGKTLSAERLRGRTVLMSFMFASCGSVCPAQTRALAEVLKALPPSVRSEVRFLSISVDPENDTPAVLKDFAASHDAALEGWYFASAGLRDTPTLLTRFAGADPRVTTAWTHPTDVYLFDRRGRMVQRYHGVPLDRDRLVREIQELVALPKT